MKTWQPDGPVCWIGESPVYPGHPLTCALILLLAYPHDLPAAGERTKDGFLVCEAELDVPTAGGHLTRGLSLIQRVLTGGMSIDQMMVLGDHQWGDAGGHAENVRPGQEQADRLKSRLREALRDAGAFGAVGQAP